MSKGCEKDTDGDGDCPIHPGGCPPFKRFDAIVGHAAGIQGEIRAFADKIDRLFPRGAIVLFTKQIGDREISFEGNVFENQYVEAERPGTGLIVAVDRRSYDVIPKASRIGAQAGKLIVRVGWPELWAAD